MRPALRTYIDVTPADSPVRSAACGWLDVDDGGAEVAAATCKSRRGDIPNAGWSIGCLSYQLTRNTFEEMAVTTHWLGFLGEQGLAYTLLVGDVPLRVQRTDQTPKSAMVQERRKLARLAKQMRLPLDDQPPLADCRVRLEFGVEGAAVSQCVLRVWSLADEGVLYHEWEIGPADTAQNVVPISRAEAEVLPPADFGVVGDAEEHETVE